MPTLAERQLARWNAIAEGWQVIERPQTIGRCHECNKGIVLITDEWDKPYTYTRDEWLALVVLHLRNHHPDLDPDT